jgi:GTP 3',8-cyclase
MSMPLPLLAPRQPAPTSGPLRDTFGRLHNNLRISVTDRCNLRCTYCMPEEVTFLDRSELLTFEEITHFVETVSHLGVDRVRLTGGEPLLRREIPRLVQMLSAIAGINDVGLTTNGLLLAEHARPLFDAGLRRINVSLDTLDAGRFRALARRNALDLVLRGIAAAQEAGFAPVKVNAVVIRGTNEVDVVPLARRARQEGWELRFIEYMPIGAEPWEREKMVPAREILEAIEREVGPLELTHDHDPSAPALDYRYRDGGGRVGVIASVSRPFCRQCNRLRLTADGKLRNCLFALNEVDVKALLRARGNDEQLMETVRRNVWDKWEGHEINTARFIKPERTMHAIGG